LSLVFLTQISENHLPKYDVGSFENQAPGVQPATTGKLVQVYNYMRFSVDTSTSFNTAISLYNRIFS